MPHILYIVHYCLFDSGPIYTVFLNSLDAVIEAMVKKKADFASRPIINSGKKKYFWRFEICGFYKTNFFQIE